LEQTKDMPVQQLFAYIDSLRVKPGRKVSLRKFHTDYDNKMMSREEGEELLQNGIKRLSQMQDMLYAHNQYSILLVFQAMDAAGKDSAIKHIMSGLNPQGVNVTSFKAPNTTELDHGYLWRHYVELPRRGEIGIFNRSHYENVLVTRVHPELILNENIPGINSVEDIDEEFWKKRFKQINRWEKTLVENGTIVVKFFLHVSKDEQKKRFLERIEDPEKNWKFSIADLKERAFWDKYMEAYEDMLSNCSFNHAPWFVIPADDKWFARVAIAAIIYQQFQKLEFSYPELDEKGKKELNLARRMLQAEEKQPVPEKPVKKASGKPVKASGKRVKKASGKPAKKIPQKSAKK
jgi:PPK2 family polyphosphate:nucleotide phosphotransferase